ncbi:DNA mismatch repair protein MutS [Halospeciosus flavus]|uniref:DNA mismatch repair protein MutS n=1 Tax=Halospeciosus flavus TaxID=3032283 RepID=A0ABD5Z5W2_9EURY|nr:DNA mismatch repair protein MutS [Halospeciosus flavus]
MSSEVGDASDDPALGPPAEMLENREELTPMVQQYVEECERYDDALVLFQVGDFYKAFCDAAETVAAHCEVTMITREDSSGEYRAAGIPVDNAASYLEKLLDADYRVAIAEQVEDPEDVSGVADRRVTRVLTPGTLTEDELLAADDNTFVACLARDGDAFGLAVLDVSTGDFLATGTESRATVADELGRFAPAEAIVGADAPRDVFPERTAVTAFDEAAFERTNASERVRDYFGAPDLAGPAEVRACGALLAYAEYTRGGFDPDEDGERLDYLTHLTRYDPREYMLLDPVAIDSLELFERRSVHGADGDALVDVLDETVTALGSRKLKDWLRRPLVEEERIEARLDAVEELRDDLRTRQQIREHLRQVYDLERLISRVARERANARDLRSLKQTLDAVPELDALLEDAGAGQLSEVREELDALPEVRDLVGSAIREDPPVEITEGEVIRPSFDDELAELRATERENKAWIDNLEERERERTGIDNLEVGHTSVHGYYIEVTNGKLDEVPDDYVRRQTLKNSERFYTPELKEREDDIIRAEQRANDLEHDIFREVRSDVADEAARVQALADTLATLDVLVGLAEVAATHDYTRPRFDREGIHVEGGRHPVVERTEERFVPNPTSLTPEEFFAVVTGPNMSGKSTYMRQVALLTVMAQVGSFVPAADADLELVDRVFTRVGASDDIAGGRSTFMVEMAELAEILEEATDDSLVVLDEVGRGTSTADGEAIAQAMAEFLHDEVGAWTLFATHHHDLTALADDLDGVANYHFAATQVEEEVEFEHAIEPGPAGASYGIEVAKAAGVPDDVVERSRALVAESEATDVETDAETDVGSTPDAGPATASADRVAADGETDPVAADVAARLRDLDVARMTPVEALTTLDELAREVDRTE